MIKIYRLLRSNKGFTLAEALGAVILLALLIPMFIIFVDGVKHVGMSKMRNRATHLAQEKMEELGSTAWDSLNPGDFGPETHESFELSWQIADVDMDGNPMTNDNVRDITVTVTWEEGERETSLVTRRYNE